MTFNILDKTDEPHKYNTYIYTASMINKITYSNTLPMTGINSSLYTIFNIDTISVGVSPPPPPVKPPTLFTALKTLRT